MERRIVTVAGIVQGVGFRPFVHRLASQLQLGGSIVNQSGSVRIEVEGETAALDHFLDELAHRPPPLARIEQLSWETTALLGQQQFHIESSCPDASGVFISPDVATCQACVGELFDPCDRRWHYPFLNCTNCGPRLTIITGAPYDRPNTTMAAMVMCPACRAEYLDPGNRRFHAQPIACPDCGPQLQLLDQHGALVALEEPIAMAIEALRSGQIVAIKGLGGFHLACDASNSAAVRQLRRRKHRDEKPLAVMVKDARAANGLCLLSTAERQLLQSPRRPIVLLRKRPGSTLAAEIAPGNPELGLMLPYTPLHHLLLRQWNGPGLVMTSGNRSDEPIAYENEAARTRLHGIADLFLMHNRPIHVRCDDSVTRVVEGQELLIRRSRGYAPEPITLPLDCPTPMLAVGGQLKSTFALGRDRQAFVSHHLGDLDHFQAFQAFERDIRLYEQLLAVRPESLICDLHPDYVSTHYATRRAASEGCPLLAVQHHHAHMASCMAEHGLHEPVIGVTFDGTGFGTDGAVWGGEFLVGDYTQFRRAAHLRYVGMPGGDQAIRHPWRMALAHLRDAQTSCDEFTAQLPASQVRTVEAMLGRRINTPMTSSSGRLFDAIAALAGVRNSVSYEGQAAMELEWLADQVPPDHTYPIDMSQEETASGFSTTVVDSRPLIRAVAQDRRAGVDPRQIARRFHSTLVEAIAHVCSRIRARTGLAAVVLSGGVFMNVLLTKETVARLKDDHFRVYRHRLVPPNDGGLSLGQLAIAASGGAQVLQSSSQILASATESLPAKEVGPCALASRAE